MLYPPARAFFTHRCPYSDCNGEFELEDAVRAAVNHSTHTAHGSVVCTGARAGEPGSKRPCELRLNYAITARPDGGT